MTAASRFHLFGCTDTGLVREQNEDHILLGRFIKNSGAMSIEFGADDDFVTAYGLLCAVADGVGGAEAGEVASRLALTTLERHFYGFEKSGGALDSYRDALLTAATRANDTVMKYAEAKPECRGMGCTLTGVCITPFGYLVFNSGDSRVYRFRSGFLKQLTDDDTLVNSAIKSGMMTYEEAEKSVRRHTITNSIGYPDFRLKILTGPELRNNDRLLICSDGLHDMVPIERMEEIVASLPVDQALVTLVSEAKNNGGHDNISVILIGYAQALELSQEMTAEPTEPETADPTDCVQHGIIEIMNEEENNDRPLS